MFPTSLTTPADLRLAVANYLNSPEYDVNVEHHCGPPEVDLRPNGTATAPIGPARDSAPSNEKHSIYLHLGGGGTAGQLFERRYRYWRGNIFLCAFFGPVGVSLEKVLFFFNRPIKIIMSRCPVRV
jgi:hypothetical protein